MATQRFADSNSGVPESSLDSGDIIPIQKSGGGRDGHITFAALEALVGAGYLDKVTYDPDGDGVVNGAHYLSYQGRTYIVQDSAKVKVSQGYDTGSRIEIKNGTVHIYTDIFGLAGLGADSDAYINSSAIMTELKMVDYIKTDGSIAMATGYSPSAAQDVVTKIYVDNKTLNLANTYVHPDYTTLTAQGGVVIGDRGIVTSDGTPANNGVYVATANMPSGGTDWTQLADGGGNLQSDGSVPMDGGYSPSVALSIATKGYVDTEIASGILDLKTQYDTYTWTIPGAITTGFVPLNMFLLKPDNETWTINKARFVALAGSGEISLQQNGTNLVGYSLLVLSTTPTQQTGASIALSDNATLGLEFDSGVGLSDVTITIQIKKVRT